MIFAQCPPKPVYASFRIIVNKFEHMAKQSGIICIQLGVCDENATCHTNQSIRKLGICINERWRTYAILSKLLNTGKLSMPLKTNGEQKTMNYIFF